MKGCIILGIKTPIVLQTSTCTASAFYIVAIDETCCCITCAKSIAASEFYTFSIQKCRTEYVCNLLSVRFLGQEQVFSKILVICKLRTVLYKHVFLLNSFRYIMLVQEQQHISFPCPMNVRIFDLIKKQWFEIIISSFEKLLLKTMPG